MSSNLSIDSLPAINPHTFLTNGTAFQMRLPGLLNTQQYVLFTRIYVSLWLTISVFGAWSNSINLRTFFKMDRGESVTILFLMLSLSDFSVCIASGAEAISTVVEIIGWTLPRRLYIDPFIVNTFLALIRRMFSVMTVLTTIVLSVQRCLCVVSPFKVKGMFTPFRTYVFMIFPIAMCALPFLVYMSLYGTEEVTDPRTNETVLILVLDEGRNEMRNGMSIATGIVLNVSSQIILLLCLAIMGNGLRKAVKFRKSAATGQGQKEPTSGREAEASGTETSGKGKQRSRETQALIQVTLVATIFVVVNMPFLTLAVAGFIVPELDLYKRYCYLYIVLFRVVFLCELINSSVNFFVYYNYNSRFRKLCFQFSSNDNEKSKK